MTSGSLGRVLRNSVTSDNFDDVAEGCRCHAERSLRLGRGIDQQFDAKHCSDIGIGAKFNALSVAL